MVHQRPISNKIVSQSKDGYQPIELSGQRYTLTLTNGDITSCLLYNKPLIPVPPNDKLRIQTYVEGDEFLFDFTGVFEIIINPYQLVIIDIIKDDENNVQNRVYSKRLEYLHEHIKKVLLLTPKQVTAINSKVPVTTLYRSLDSSYMYGSDLCVSPANNESVYIIVGEGLEQKEQKILIHKMDYDTIGKVPKVVRCNFSDDLDDVNKWKDEMFENEDTVKVMKGEKEFVEFDNTEQIPYYLIVGKAQCGAHKIFGKVKKTPKIDLVDTTPSESISYEWISDYASFTEVKYYMNGYVVGCASPKVGGKHLSTVTVMDVRQNIDLSQAIGEAINDIPTIQSQAMKRKLNGAPVSMLVDELASRLVCMPQHNTLVDSLFDICKHESQISNKRLVVYDDSEDEEEVCEPSLKRQNTTLE